MLLIDSSPPSVESGPANESKPGQKKNNIKMGTQKISVRDQEISVTYGIVKYNNNLKFWFKFILNYTMFICHLSMVWILFVYSKTIIVYDCIVYYLIFIHSKKDILQWKPIDHDFYKTIMHSLATREMGLQSLNQCVKNGPFKQPTTSYFYYGINYF